MKVTFDSNVWQLVVAPEEAASDPDAAGFAKIYAAIVDKRITPYLSETIFTLEGINKKDRKGFFEEYEPKFETTESADGNTISLRFSIGPDEDAHPGNHQYLAKYLAKAVSLGFKTIHAPRIGGVTNKDVKEYLAEIKKEDFAEFEDKMGKVGQRIDELGCGMQPLINILKPYPREQSIHKWIANAPDSEANRISKAIAEWADGDSITAHIAMNGDFFCTRDGAKGAGTSSILSAANVKVLEDEFGFKKGTPAELAALL